MTLFLCAWNFPEKRQTLSRNFLCEGWKPSLYGREMTLRDRKKGSTISILTSIGNQDWVLHSGTDPIPSAWSAKTTANILCTKYFIDISNCSSIINCQSNERKDSKLNSTAFISSALIRISVSQSHYLPPVELFLTTVPHSSLLESVKII